MEELESVFDFPEYMKETLKEGFRVVSRLNKSKIENLVQWALEPRPNSYYGDTKSLADSLELGREEAGALRLVVSMTFSAMGRSTVQPSEFISIGVERGLLEEQDTEEIELYLQEIVKNRDAVQKRNQTSHLQNVVLPSLTEFEVTVDVRIEYSDGKIGLAVPVVIAYIDTDAENQLVWFQMNKERVREMRDTLNSLVEQIEDVEAWLPKGTGT